MILFLIIGAILVYYFLFVYISESSAKEILKENYSRNQSTICNRFYVGSSKCPAFTECYVERAVSAIPKNILIQFAKDIKANKSSAIDSYSLINGKQIGENCVSQILNIPNNVDVNIIN